MLSLFPQILFLSPLAPFAIRVTLACLFAYAAWRHLSSDTPLLKAASILEIALGASLLSGAWTQAGAVAGFCYLALSLALPRMRAYPTSTIILALVMLATLTVTGAGAFAFDLPL